MQVPFPIIIAQINLVGSVLSVVVAVVASFVLITLISSYYRFQHIVEEAEEKGAEEMGASAGEVLRVQLARYLAGCARRNTSFSIALIRHGNPEITVRMGTPFINAIKQAARRDDVVCVFDDETAVLLAESEPEDAETILTRVVRAAAAGVEEVSLEAVRVGVASYPGHGLSGRELIQVAQDGLAQSTAERLVVLPEIIDVDAEDDEGSAGEEIPDEAEPVEKAANVAEPVKGRSLKVRRKDNILDPVTGVLKPSAVSTYMQRMMSDLRYKKQNAALFCIGVNNMDHIERFHGVGTANDVLAGVSRILQDHLRSTDLIGRHEKHAFLALAKCSLEEAEEIGRRITSLVQQHPFESGAKKLKTTITLGLAAYPEHGRNLLHLYAAGQKVLDYSRTNDIRSSAVYDPEIHDKVVVKPMKSIKSVKA